MDQEFYKEEETFNQNNSKKSNEGSWYPIFVVFDFFMQFLVIFSGPC
jgi:hypothetical protein